MEHDRVQSPSQAPRHGLVPLQRLTVGSNPARFKGVSPYFPARSSGYT